MYIDSLTVYNNYRQSDEEGKEEDEEDEIVILEFRGNTNNRDFICGWSSYNCRRGGRFWI